MKIFTGIAAIFMIFGLAACGTSEGVDPAGQNTNTPESHYTFYQSLPDGGKVLCVWAKSGYGGGLSCDWGSANAE